MLQIKEDDKFYSRLLSKESSAANPSFRVYYGGVNVGVPFVWEAKPGTPKHPGRAGSDGPGRLSVPPLTPPPSYSRKSGSSGLAQAQPKKPAGSKILHGLCPRIMHRRQISSSSSSTLSSWSSGSGSGSGFNSTRTMSRSLSLSGPGSLFDFVVNDHEVEEIDMNNSPKSTLCFGLGSCRRTRPGPVRDQKV